MNTGVISSANSPLDYHADGDQGNDCLNSACHAVGNVNGYTEFTLAGVVMQTETNTAYSLGDAAVQLFYEECDFQRYGCQPGVDPLQVVFRTLPSKALAEVNRRGHFYTTQPINWNLITYATLANYDPNTLCRNIKHMLAPVPIANGGNCYACHNGTTQPLITIKAILDPNNLQEQCVR